MSALFKVARQVVLAGMSVIPCGAKTKRPAIEAWKPYQARLAVEAELRAWFPEATAIALVCGAVSGNAEVIDFDQRAEVYDRWAATVEAEVPGLVARLYRQRSQSGGRHVIYRCTDPVSGNRKLARRPRDGRGPLVLVETRGEGGYVLVAPSPGYEVLDGVALVDLPVITAREREILVSCARAFDEVADERPPDVSPPGTGEGLRPGDDFNRRGDVREILLKNGWTSCGVIGANERWRRPKKSSGTSASLQTEPPRLLYVFSPNAPPFQRDKAYMPFSVYAMLEHRGDFAVAARALAAQGYGSGRHESGGARTRSEGAGPAKRRAVPLLPWRPVPVEILPDPCAAYVRALSAAMVCDPVYAVIPLLVALAGCVGNRRRIRLKRDWTEACVIWGAVVGRSGTVKSPAQHAVFAPLHADEVEEISRHQAEMESYQGALEEWQDADKKSRGERPEKPEPPARLLISDITVETVADRHAENPLGLILARDELAGWLQSFDMYRKGRGGDVQKWIEMHGGRPMIVDRKSTEKKILCVPRAAVSIVGGVQPGVLREALGNEHFVNGLAARLLMAAPRPQRKRWTDQEIPEEASAAIAALFRGLRGLAPSPDNGGAPLDLPLAPEARDLWIPFYNRHAERQTEAPSDDLAAAFAKLEGYAARFALLFHLVDTIATGADSPVTAKAAEAGIGLAEWFVHEEERVYALLREDVEASETRELVEIIRARGGRITVRDLMHATRRYREGARSAKDALDGLVREGAGRWEPVPPGATGGRPAEAFVLDPEWGSGTVTGELKEEMEFGDDEGGDA